MWKLGLCFFPYPSFFLSLFFVCLFFCSSFFDPLQKKSRFSVTMRFPHQQTWQRHTSQGRLRALRVRSGRDQGPGGSGKFQKGSSRTVSQGWLHTILTPSFLFNTHKKHGESLCLPNCLCQSRRGAGGEMGRTWPDSDPPTVEQSLPISLISLVHGNIRPLHHSFMRKQYMHHDVSMCKGDNQMVTSRCELLLNKASLNNIGNSDYDNE